MSKQDSRPGLEAGVTRELKQQDVATLLKKKVQDQDEAAAPKEADVAAAEASAFAAAEPAMVASAGEMIASDVTPLMMAQAGQTATGGGLAGLSTGAWVGIGVAAVGGGLLIAEAMDDDDDNAAAGGTAPPAGAKNIELTANQDDVGNSVTDEDFQISTDGTDIVHGVVDPGSVFANDQTFSVGDVIHGNGKTIVRLEVASGGAADVVEMSDIARVELINNGASVTFFAGSWENVGEVALVGGPGGGAFLTDAAVGIDMSIAANVGNVGAFIGASYTNNLVAGVANSGKGGGSMVHDANNVLDLAVNVANLNSGSMFFANVAPGDVTVGNMTGVAGNSAALFAGAVGLAAGDVTVGDIDLSLGDLGLATVFLGVSGELNAGDISVTMGDTGTAFITVTGTSDITVGDITVVMGNSASFGTTSGTGGLFLNAFSGNLNAGNISVTVGDNSFVDLSITAASDVVVGDISVGMGDFTLTPSFSGHWHPLAVSVFAGTDVTVGNVDLALGNWVSSGTGHVWFSITAGTAGSGGNISVGDISLVGGDNVSATVSLTFSTSGTDITVGDVTVAVGDRLSTTTGDTSPFAAVYITNSSALAGADITVGTISMSAGLSGSVDVDVYLTGIGGTTQTGDLGNLTVGGLNVTLGENGTGDVEIYQFQTASTSMQQGVGSFTVGDMVLNLGQDASLDIEFSQWLTGSSQTGAGVMGDFTVGNMTANLGIGADLTYTVNAYNSATSASFTAMNLGNITVGDVTIVADDAASIDVFYSFSANSGDIPSVSIGDFNATVGVSASVTISAYMFANNIDAVNIGDWTFNIGQFGWGDHYVSISATSGDLGPVTVGDITVNLAQSASFSDIEYWIFATGDIASVSLGDLNVSLATNAIFTDSITFSISASGDVGNVSVGDINIEMDAGSTFSSTSINYNIYGDNVGDVTFGDISIVGHGTTDSVSVNISVTATGDIGNVSLGDVSLVADSSASGSQSVSLWLVAGGEIGDIAVGNVLFSYTASSTAPLTFTLNQTAATSGDVTIGGLLLDFTAVGTTAAAATEFYTFNVFAGSGDVRIDLVDVDIVISSTYTAAAATELTNLLNLSSILGGVTGSSISIGTVDYSGVVYNGTLVNPTLTIDVSGYTGDIAVIGSGLNDVIIANTTGVMTFTGGGGADMFDFGVGNDALARANVSKVTDFQHAVDDILLDTNGIAGTEYAELNTASTSFADFLADATLRANDPAGEDYIIAGTITGEQGVFVAVDNNQDGTIDFVIQLENMSLGSLDFADFVQY